MQRPDLLTSPDYATMRDRLANNDALDRIVSDWIKSQDYAVMKEIVDREGVPVNLIYSIEDIFNDPHYAAREDIVEMPDEALGTIKMPGIVPKFSKTPGTIQWTGPTLGKHNQEIYGDLLGLQAEDLATLKEEGAI